MASSDDESEGVIRNVSDYKFESDKEEPVSFAVLPLEWGDGETRNEKPQEIFLSGKTDCGLRNIYKQVIAWKFDLPAKEPVVSVLSVEGHWIKLLKPWKPFHDIIRTIQVTLHLLHFVKWNPQRPKKALLDYLNKTFSMFERLPREDDLADHLSLINEAVKRDENFANSKILNTLLAEKPWERKTINEGVVNSSFIVDDDSGNEDQGESDESDENEDDESEEDNCYDGVCAICDNGGDVLLCDGKCLRSFHATPEDGEDSNCVSLGFTKAEWRAIKKVDFYCENCKYKMHQCFACGELGSTDESSPEVFCCVNGACGYFYHSHCVAKLLHPGNSAAAKDLELRIAAGEQFACPAHRCLVCKEVEVTSNTEMQFAVCRRCPRAYHRKCLPREITSADDADEEGEIIQRAWENLIPNRILIYCLDHEIDPELLTPARDHIKFPEGKKKRTPSEPSKKKDLSGEKGLALEDNVANKISAKPPRGVDKISCSSVRGKLSNKRVEKFPVQAASKKQKVATSGNSLGKSKQSKTDEGQRSSGYQSAYNVRDSELVKCSSGDDVDFSHEITQKVKPPTKRVDNTLSLDTDSRERILALMKDASSSMTLEKVKKMHRSPSTHVPYSRLSIDTISLGRVEASVQGLNAALRILEGGGRIQDAKVICGDAILSQALRWKEKLKVYLAPFLFGARYTSFGRHFTKVDKLKEIVDILHWYFQDGDMLVDFCCGLNDFSCLTKKKLDEMGKSCSFKNYDIHQTKNDFNFERRDWMGVKPEELADGSQLIMGLNPPFGVKASLANKFIDKALEFKPKLLILIVPRETQRLDEKESPYDLIWEDDHMFAGKSFYLPGSVDVNDQQIDDWNLSAPVLYLWSRGDWTHKHRAIAEQHGHISGALKNCIMAESRNEKNVPDSAQGCRDSDKSLVKQVKDLHVVEPENLKQKDREIITTNQEKKDREIITTDQEKKDREIITTDQEQKDREIITTNHQEDLSRDVNGSEKVQKNHPAKKDSESKPIGHGGKGNGKSNFAKKRKEFGWKGKRKGGPMMDRGQNYKRPREDRSEFGGKGKNNRRSMEGNSTSKISMPRHPSPNVDKISGTHHFSPNVADTYSPRARSHSARVEHQQLDVRNSPRYQTHHHQAGYAAGGEDMDDVVNRYIPHPGSSSNYMRSPGSQPYVRSTPHAYDGYMGPVEIANNFGEAEMSYQRPILGPPPQYGDMGASATQRYAPNLDGLNHHHGRIPMMPTYHHHHHHRGQQPPPLRGSLGFAPYPPTYSHNSTSGWVME